VSVRTNVLRGAAGGVLLLAAAACGGSSGAGSTGGDQSGAGPVQHPSALVGDVGKDDAFTISLTDGNGDDITNLAAGTYKLTVHDFSSMHNFHLEGSGVDESTGVSDIGTKTFTVTFKPGDYTFVCDPHSSTMHGEFTVS
jgi:plastocyanin